MMNITLEEINLEDPKDIEVLHTLAALGHTVVKQLLESDDASIETTVSPVKPAAELPAMATKDILSPSLKNDQGEALYIDKKQAESLMGQRVQNIRNCAAKMSDYRALISEHPNKRGHWVVGDKLKKVMQTSDLLALQDGKSLKVPVVLPTWKINSALKDAWPESPPKYCPHNDIRNQHGVTIFGCKPEGGKKLFYYLTRVSDLKDTRPDYHMAIENYFLKTRAFI